MVNLEIPSAQREFRCVHCNGKILIPRDLSPTTGPCPHCTGVITSPAIAVAARLNVRVDSATGRTLSIINWRGVKDALPITRTATVELKWTGEPSAPELEISRFICWEFLGTGRPGCDSDRFDQVI